MEERNPSSARILVATDQIEEQNEAVACGLALGRALERDVVVIKVFGRQPDEDERERFAEAVSRWAKAGAYPAAARVRFGDEDKAIVETARETASDIIVLGAHRSDLLADLFGKSMVEDVVEDTRRTIMVAAPGTHAFNRILVYVDCSQPSAHAAVVAHRLFPKATISFVRPWHVPYEGLLSGQPSHDGFERMTKRETTEFLKQLDLRGDREDWQLGELLVREGDTVPVIEQAVADEKFDLLVLGVEGESGLFTSALPPMTQRLLEQPPCDVLVVQGPIR